MCLFRCPTRSGLCVRGCRGIGRSGVRTPLPQAADLAECYHFDLDGDNGRRAVRDGVHSPSAMISTTLAGVAWALPGSELWVAGQRVMPGWVRGRMNGFLIMLGQGSMALGAVLWATGVAHVGLDLIFPVAAVLALAVVVLGQRFSINFATEASVEAAPLDYLHDLPVVPGDDVGPILSRGARWLSRSPARFEPPG